MFNCDGEFDAAAMGRIFAGLMLTGSWGCFDEFNRLGEDVLSTVSQQIQAIQVGGCLVMCVHMGGGGGVQPAGGGRAVDGSSADPDDTGAGSFTVVFERRKRSLGGRLSHLRFGTIGTPF